VNSVVNHPLRQVEHSGGQNNEQEDRKARQKCGPNLVEDIFVNGCLQGMKALSPRKPEPG